MTTGLAIIFFGWIGPLCTIVKIFKGPEAGDQLFMDIMDKLGPIVDGTLDAIFNHGID